MKRFVDPVQHERPAFSILGRSGSERIRTYLTAAGSHDLLFPSIHAPLGKNETTTKPVSEWGNRRELCADHPDKLNDVVHHAMATLPRRNSERSA
jgi:hypothetical protein